MNNAFLAFRFIFLGTLFSQLMGKLLDFTRLENGEFDWITLNQNWISNNSLQFARRFISPLNIYVCSWDL